MLEWTRRLVMLARRGRQRREIDEELRSHYEALCEELEASGHDPAEAARLARLRLGGLLQNREAAADVWQIGRLEPWVRDAGLAWRALRRSPAFLLAAVATLALGIGVTTAIFSVVYGVAFRPLPYPEPGRLVRIYESNLANNKPHHEVSVGAFSEWRAATRTLSSIGLVSKTSTWYPAMPDPPALRHAGVSPAFFDVLGARPIAGRFFRPDHGYSAEEEKEIVISYDVWQRLFGGAPSAVGSTLSITGGPTGARPYRVVGVAPRSFSFLEPTDLWTPQFGEKPPVNRLLRLWRYDSVVARLAPGASMDQARAELRAVSARLAKQHPDTNGGWSCDVLPLLDDVIGRFASASWMLLGAVACVLLVACANVAGLLLARATAREQETAVRLALGAGRWALLRLWLIEGVLLAVMGATIGVLVAWWGVAVLKRIAPPSLPRIDSIGLDVTSLAAAAIAAIVAVLAFAVASSVALRRSLTVATGGWRGHALAAPHVRLRNALVALQSALAVALVVVATLLALSFVRLGRVDLGWRPQGVLSLTAAPSFPGQRPWYSYMLWADSLVRRLEAAPEVERAAITTQIPLGLDPYSTTLARGAMKIPGEPYWPIVQHVVSDHYFETMSIALRDGRRFDRRDAYGEMEAIDGSVRPERGVAIVSESVARTLWPGERAIGKMVRLTDIDNVKYREVVGVVGDLQFITLGEIPSLHVFIPWSQMPSPNPRLVVRGRGRAEDLLPVVRAAVQAERPGTGIDRVISLDSLVDRATSQTRFSSEMVMGFGLLAIVLAAVGTYGTTAYLVGARRREIGLRIALGARPPVVVRHVLGRGLWPVSVGGLAGLAIAAGASRTMTALFFQVGALDARAYVLAAVALLVAAAGAAVIPAIRAARIDPAITLRVE